MLLVGVEPANRHGLVPALEDAKSDTESVSVRSLLLEAYRNIGEPDSLYGACSTHVADDTTRLLLYEHEGEWHKSLSKHHIFWMVGDGQTDVRTPCF